MDRFASDIKRTPARSTPPLRLRAV
jgi:hypothetical protein